tara:strand:+ start:2198 stop:3478 length:1281 start_codon:yes stop_codon:yes gene_type:complete
MIGLRRASVWLIAWSSLALGAEGQSSTSITFNNFNRAKTYIYDKATSEWEDAAGHRVKISRRLIVKTTPDMGAESLLKITPYLREPVLLYQSTSFRYYALKIQNTKLQSQLDDLTLHKEVLLVQPDILQRRLSNSNSSSKPSSLSDHQYQDYLTQTGLRSMLRNHRGSGIKVAVIDDGFFLGHEALSKAKRLTSLDVEELSVISGDVSNGGMHGTMVASILFGESEEVEGIVPEASWIPIRQVTNWTSRSLLAYQHAKSQGADVINCSWTSPWLLEPMYDVVHDLAHHGRKGKGTVIVFSAGNKGVRIGPADNEASISEAVIVGAHDHRNQKLKRSNWGPSVDLYAYGGVAKAAAAEGGYTYLTATSLSAAIVSGIAAILLSEQPGMTAFEVEKRLKSLFVSDALFVLDKDKGSNSYGYSDLPKIQ